VKYFPIIAGVWAALLVAGFALVFVLGAPVATADEEIQAALDPPTPVTQETAETAASTIVRLQYPSFAGTTRTVTKATDFGVDHWVVEYSDTTGDAPRGLRISIVVDTGHVEINTFP
jgi:hypothetical protein